MKSISLFFLVATAHVYGSAELIQCQSTNNHGPRTHGVAPYSLTVHFDEEPGYSGSFQPEVLAQGTTEITGPRTFVKFNSDFAVTGFYKRIGFMKMLRTTLPNNAKLFITEQSYNNEDPLDAVNATLTYNPDTSDQFDIYFQCSRHLSY